MTQQATARWTMELGRLVGASGFIKTLRRLALKHGLELTIEDYGGILFKTYHCVLRGDANKVEHLCNLVKRTLE